MTLGRPLLVVALTTGIGLPLAVPVLGLVIHPAGWAALTEFDRIGTLARNSVILAVGAVAVAVPIGVIAAILLERTRVRGGRGLRAVVVVGLFVPLPVYAAAWRTTARGDWLGEGVVASDPGEWRPWAEGPTAAAAVHAAAGLPWVVWLVSLAVRTTDPRVEEDALLAGGTRAALRWVVWPRVVVSATAAGCIVAVQTLTEVTVTDLMLVRTFAEEAYTQLVGNPDGVAAATAVTVPAWALAAAIAVWLGRRAETSVPTSPALSEPQRPLHTGLWVTVASTFGLWVGFAVVVGLPVVGLFATVGEVGPLLRVIRVHGLTLADSLLWAAVAGAATVGLALPACWGARGSGRVARVVLGLAAVAWVTPAPLVGLGLKGMIDALVSAEDWTLAVLDLDPAFPPLRSLLYDQPSPLPAVWAMVIRFFPIAIALLWPAVRQISPDLLDAARLDGAVWRGVVWPQTRAACGRAVIAVGALGAAEVVAVKLVQPPGRQSFAEDVFNAMHYGADTTVAAMCLLQITVAVVVCGIFMTRFGGRTPDGG